MFVYAKKKPYLCVQIKEHVKSIKKGKNYGNVKTLCLHHQ